MDKGVRFVISLIAIILVMIAERGVPIKLKKWDALTYVLTFGALLMITGYFR